MSVPSQCPEKQSSVKNYTNFPVRDALYVSKTEKTFANDENLPSLPVPSLNQTLEKYLDSVKSLVTPEEFNETQKIVAKFQNDVGKKLHAKLLEKAQNERNWLEKWWEDLAYLSNRVPLIPFSSMIGYTNMDNLWPPVADSQTERAALYVYFKLHFWKLLREERVKPHSSQNTPWSMHQFRRYFNTVRIPGQSIDTIKSYFHTEFEEPLSPTHIVVFHRGHIFSFDTVDEYGDILIPPELQSQFERIQSWCNQNGPGACVGALTCTDRDTWAKNRACILQEHPENELHMETIESAISVLVLEDDEPVGNATIIKQIYSGNSSNYWADKSEIFVVYKNGTSGLISDHSPFDGLVPVVTNHFVYSSLQECGGKWKGPQTVRDLLPPRRLEFHLKDSLKNSIEKAKHEYRLTASNIDVAVEIFTKYGKAFLKPHDFHPETYAQFALQLAYYTMHGKPAPTYVTASTRQFYHGRTETMRSCFPEVMDWVHAMVEDNKSSGEKLQLMHIAADKFKKLMKDCTNNEGCDRHLLGLYIISKEENMPVPDIFLDPSFSKSGGNGNFILSTSCVGFTPLGGCVVPMKDEGYGTFYNIENNRFTFTVSAFKHCSETSAAKFCQSIERALIDMQHLLVTAKL